MKNISGWFTVQTKVSHGAWSEGEGCSSVSRGRRSRNQGGVYETLVYILNVLLLQEREDQVKKKLAAATNSKEPSSVAANISSSTPVMASIMKEETENRELVSDSSNKTTKLNQYFR